MVDGDSLVLVTGGAGFIGGHIAERLIRDGAHVRVLDNFATGSRATADFLRGLAGGRCEIVEADIRDRAAVAAALSGVTHVIHQAALPSVQRSLEDPIASNDTNIGGTMHLLEESRSRGVRRFVFAGSSSVYGDQPDLPKRESMPPRPLSPYALTKLAGETYCSLYHRLFGFPAVTLRYFNVFGPRQNPDSQYAAVIPLFIRAVLQETPPTIYGDGGQTRDFTFVDNVVEANLRALTADPEKVGGAVMNVACGERTSLLELLSAICEITGRRAEPVFAPARQGDVRDSLAAIAEAEQRLGFTPAVSLREGLSRTIDWFRNIEQGDRR